MLFMVVEKFRSGNPRAVGERFKARGRMLPDGITHEASWMDLNGARCFQLMTAPDAEDLERWTRNWDDLVDFEITEVQSSTEFWSKMRFDLPDSHPPDV